MGCYEIFLEDTIQSWYSRIHGSNAIKEVVKLVHVASLAVHCHDTYGQALANIAILIAIKVGNFSFDSLKLPYFYKQDGHFSGGCISSWFRRLSLCPWGVRQCCHRRRDLHVAWNGHRFTCTEGILVIQNKHLYVLGGTPSDMHKLYLLMIVI